MLKTVYRLDLNALDSMYKPDSPELKRLAELSHQLPKELSAEGYCVEIGRTEVNKMGDTYRGVLVEFTITNDRRGFNHGIGIDKLVDARNKKEPKMPYKTEVILETKITLDCGEARRYKSLIEEGGLNNEEIFKRGLKKARINPRPNSNPQQ